MQSYIQRKVSQCAQNVKGRDMRMKGFDEGKIYTIKKVNDVSASFKCTQKRYLSQRYRLLRGGVPSIFVIPEISIAIFPE